MPLLFQLIAELLVVIQSERVAPSHRIPAGIRVEVRTRSVPDGVALQKALDRIRALTAEAEVGRIYRGTVRKIVDFGAFVEIFPGTDGLVHISQLANERVRKVSDVLKEGDVIDVKVLEVDRSGKIRLSRKDAMKGGGSQEMQQ